jgi:hypothetical protein
MTTYIRVLPPANGPFSMTFALRTYSCPAGSSLDVPDFDARVLIANGWTKTADGVGATSARPIQPQLHQSFHDTTLGHVIVWDGKTWRDPANGQAV